jgi:dolichol-phosphate mannosyltransferase
VDIPVDTGDFRLLDRRAADGLRDHRERNRFIRRIVLHRVNPSGG